MVYNFLKNKIWWNEARRSKNPTKCVKSNLNEISRGWYKSKERKVHWKTLNCFTSHDKLLFKKQQKQLVIHLVIKLPIKLWGFHKQNKGERESSSQNEHTFRGGGGAWKWTRANKGGGGCQISGILSKHTFWMSPQQI